MSNLQEQVPGIITESNDKTTVELSHREPRLEEFALARRRYRFGPEVTERLALMKLMSGSKLSSTLEKARIALI